MSLRSPIKGKPPVCECELHPLRLHRRLRHRTEISQRQRHLPRIFSRSLFPASFLEGTQRCLARGQRVGAGLSLPPSQGRFPAGCGPGRRPAAAAPPAPGCGVTRCGAALLTGTRTAANPAKLLHSSLFRGFGRSSLKYAESRGAGV